jgi:hypothetical protein
VKSIINCGFLETQNSTDLCRFDSLFKEHDRDTRFEVPRVSRLLFFGGYCFGCKLRARSSLSRAPDTMSASHAHISRRQVLSRSEELLSGQ